MINLRKIEFAPDYKSVLLYLNCRAFSDEGVRLNCLRVTPEGLVSVFYDDQKGFVSTHSIAQNVISQVKHFARYYAMKFGGAYVR